jgi:hypothetical protein
MLCSTLATFCAFNIKFYQRTLLGTSANQKRHIIKSNKRLNNLHKDRFTDLEPFPTFVPNTHKLYILRHCINIVLILQKKYIDLLTN